MSGIFTANIYLREAVRVKVKKCEKSLPPEWRKFSVDPQITSLEVLYSILAKAFDLRSDFAISYRTMDPNGKDIYLAVLSDWDLDAAFLRAHNLSIASSSEPCLNLRVDIKPFSEAPDWDAANTTPTGYIRNDISASPLQQSIGVGQKYVQNMQTRLPGIIMNQMEKTFSMVTRALNFADEQNSLQPPRPPLSDTEFRCFLDSVGQIKYPHELRKVIYSGGIDPSLRRVVWKHILNVYPNGMTGRERMDYMKRKAAEYFKLRDTWRTAVQRGSVAGELAYVTSMVRKDVLRTDRLHPFYAGSDDNQNIASLFNILTTYALNHPAVSYCQGMSDIASPLLVTMGDEAQAYICFCAVMTRLNANFMLDGVAMTLKFTHLAEALQHYDPEFYEYLKLQQADDLLFCYRWLLLEMKREFAFEDSLRMLEVLWSALPAEPPTTELALYEKEFVSPPIEVPAVAPKSPSVVMRQPRENAYTKICELRRQSSALSLHTSCSPPTTAQSAGTSYVVDKSLNSTKRLNQSLDENVTRRRNRTRSVTKSHQSLDETKMLLLLDNSDLQAQISSGDTAEQLFDEIQTPSSTHLLELNKNEENLLRSRSTSPSSDSSVKAHCDAVKTSGVSSHKYSCGHSKHKPNLNNISVLSKQLHHHHRKGGGHFKELKERIAASKKGIFASLESEETNEVAGGEKTASKTQKVVKNFNEFLNFASINKSRISDKLNKPTAIDSNNKIHQLQSAKPLIKLTNSSFEEADGSPIRIDTQDLANQLDGCVAQQLPPQPLQLKLAVDDGRQGSIDGSSPEDSQEYFPMTTSMTRELRLELENLDRHVFGSDFQQQQRQQFTNVCDTPETGDSLGGNMAIQQHPSNYSNISYTKLKQLSSTDGDEDTTGEICRCPSDKDIGSVMLRNRIRNGDNSDSFKRISTSSANADVFIWENPLHQFSPSSTILDFHNKSTDCGLQAANTYDDDDDDQPRCDVLTLNTSTPDEQIDLEYDESILETTVMGKKTITPIRLVCKNGNASDPPISIRRTKNVAPSKRISAIFSTNDSDSDVSSGGDSWNESSVKLPGCKTVNNDEQQPQQQLSICQYDINQSEILLDIEKCSDRASAAGAHLITSVEEASETNVALTRVAGSLPAPNEFGGGNPFLMFLCLTLLLQHRNYCLKSNLDYNEMAMHFDKMVRKHNVTSVLNQSRRMYSDYLKSQKMMNAVGVTVLSGNTNIGNNSNSSAASNNLNVNNVHSGGTNINHESNVYRTHKSTKSDIRT